MKTAVTCIAWMVFVVVLVWAVVVLTSPDFTTKEVQEACRGHEGVAQYVGSSLSAPTRNVGRPFVICRDGAVSAVGR